MIEEAGDAAGADPEKKWTKRDLRHTSAVVICPPSSQWGPIQEIRSVNDKSYVRWMPHVNLLYPFLLATTTATRRPVAASTPPRRWRGSPRRHRAVHGDASNLLALRARNSCTVWLHPSEPLEGDDPARRHLANADVDAHPPPVSRGITSTQAALERAFPFADQLSAISPHSGYTPHLSVGQWDDVASAAAAERTLRDAWEPVTFEVDAVYQYLARVRMRRSNLRLGFPGRTPVGRGGGAAATTQLATAGMVDGGVPPAAAAEGARCLRPRPKRRWRVRRGKGGGGRRGTAPVTRGVVEGSSRGSRPARGARELSVKGTQRARTHRLPRRRPPRVARFPTRGDDFQEDADLQVSLEYRRPADRRR